MTSTTDPRPIDGLARIQARAAARRRATVVLWNQGLTYAEIADRQGRSVQAVSGDLRRARLDARR